MPGRLRPVIFALLKMFLVITHAAGLILPSINFNGFINSWIRSRSTGREFPVEKGGKALQFIYSSREFTTKGGLTATTATTNVYRSEAFKATMRDVQSQCSSPDEVIFEAATGDFAQSLYCHLLCGLHSRAQVQSVTATFAHSVVLAFQTFERVWEELCADIRRGSPSPTRVTSPALRRAVSARLARPDPALADAVGRACAGLSNWYGVIPALWPNAKYVYGIMTGSMEHYVRKLRHYAGGLPLVAAEYGASEGWIGANVDPGVAPESATFTVLPDIGFFEFIPLGSGCSTTADACCGEEEPVGLTEVVVGEHYEVVMTTFAGIYARHMHGANLNCLFYVRCSMHEPAELLCRCSSPPPARLREDGRLAVVQKG